MACRRRVVISIIIACAACAEFAQLVGAVAQVMGGRQGDRAAGASYDRVMEGRDNAIWQVGSPIDCNILLQYS